jgi:uncharacterized protein
VAERSIGLVSDTHGLLRPAALDALQGVELILHAGDVGGSAVISGLRAIAPVRAVHGNCDPREAYPGSIDIELDGIRIHVSHGHELGSPTPDRLVSRYDTDIIVYGHTHKPLVRRIGRQLVINPGAAGPRRFNLKPSVARLELPSCGVTILDLE